jgi:trk/ktr system potassium uptake protein
MRSVFVGAGELAVETASLLIERGDEVVMIEADREKIDELSEKLDCSFLQGDGSKPQLLEEVNPKKTDYLFCLTDNDQHNIIAALVGRSLGFDHVIVQIHDTDFLPICRELGLQNTIVPAKTIGRYLADMVAGKDILELSSFIKGEARFMLFAIDARHQGDVGELELPEGARVVCRYRDREFSLADAKTTLKKGDEVLILTHSNNLGVLTEQFLPEIANGQQGS